MKERTTDEIRRDTEARSHWALESSRMLAFSCTKEVWSNCEQTQGSGFEFYQDSPNPGKRVDGRGVIIEIGRPVRVHNPGKKW